MIGYVKRSELDVAKYNLCIENSKNSRIYAFSWYLDIVADNWDVLILNDYEAVMPLPWRSKNFIKYIYPPCWAQQLGVFSAKTIDNKLTLNFIKSIPKKFKKITLNLNSENPISNKRIIDKTNYILPLNKPYSELLMNYKQVRRRHKNRSNSEKFSISKTNISQETIQLFIKEKQNIVDLKESDYNKLEQLIAYLNDKKRVTILTVKDEKEVLLGGAFFLKDSKRLTYLFSSTSKEGREKKVMTYIIDSMIEEYSASHLILDFEGSVVPGIAFFFKSFGAEKEMYFNYQKRLFF